MYFPVYTLTSDLNLAPMHAMECLFFINDRRDTKPIFGQLLPRKANRIKRSDAQI